MTALELAGVVVCGAIAIVVLVVLVLGSLFEQQDRDEGGRW